VKKSGSFDWNTAVSTGENARRALPRLAREYFALGRAAAMPGASPPELHAFRLASKRFRYTLELFLPLYGPCLAERVEQVRKIQGLLGDRQDCVVLAERLKRHDGTAAELHALLHKLNAEGRALEEKFRRHWQGTFDAPGEELAWMRYLSRRPPAPRPRLHEVQARLLSATNVPQPVSAPTRAELGHSGPPADAQPPAPARRSPAAAHSRLPKRA
jgi:hypothetical protein